ncbi:MAG: hypothetical protein Kow0019_08980 [Methanobacteriaceae archaeon]
MEDSEKEINDLKNRATKFYDQERFYDAINCLDKALKLDPHSPKLFYNKGVIFFKLQKDEKAIDSFKKALKIDPHFNEANDGIRIVNENIKKDYDLNDEVFKLYQEEDFKGALKSQANILERRKRKNQWNATERDIAGFLFIKEVGKIKLDLPGFVYSTERAMNANATWRVVNAIVNAVEKL